MNYTDPNTVVLKNKYLCWLDLFCFKPAFKVEIHFRFFIITVSTNEFFLSDNYSKLQMPVPLHSPP